MLFIRLFSVAPLFVVLGIVCSLRTMKAKTEEVSIHGFLTFNAKLTRKGHISAKHETLSLLLSVMTIGEFGPLLSFAREGWGGGVEEEEEERI